MGATQRTSAATPRTGRRLGLALGLIGLGAGAWGLWWLLGTAPTPDAPEGVETKVVWVPTDAAPREALPDAAMTAPASAPATAATKVVRRRPKNDEEAVLAVPADKRRMVVNVRTLLDSEMGQAVLRCVPPRDRRELRKARAQGFDPLKRFDKVVVAGDTAVVFGDLGGDAWQQMSPETQMRRMPEGDDAERFVPVLRGSDGTPLEGSDEMGGLTVWQGRALIGAGPTASDQRAVLARLRGGEVADNAAPPLTTSGDIHGELPGSDLIDSVPVPYQVRRPLMEMLDGLGVRMQLEVDIGDQANIRVGLVGAGALVEEAVAAAVDTLRNAPVQGMEAEGEPDERADAMRGILAGMEVGRGKDGMHINLKVTKADLRSILGDCVDNGVVPGDPDDVPEPDEANSLYIPEPSSPDAPPSMPPDTVPAMPYEDARPIEVDLPEPVLLDAPTENLPVD